MLFLTKSKGHKSNVFNLGNMLKAVNYFQTCENLFKYWFILLHFALVGPVEVAKSTLREGNCMKIFQISMLILHFYKFQVTIHEDSMSIADSIFSMRVANALPPNSGMNGRHSRQSSLSIQSASGIRASPTIGLFVHGLLIFLMQEN